MTSDIKRQARQILEAAWVPDGGFCVPNPETYPHQWLWDSCFHSLGWLGLGDERAVTELTAIFAGQTPSGFVPHMRYRDRRRRFRRDWPETSRRTQPPVYGIVVDRLIHAGIDVPTTTLEAARRAARNLLSSRRVVPTGLLAVYHPWETGADDSPRWDGWVGTSSWSRFRFSMFDRLIERAEIVDDEGMAMGSKRFGSCPAAFNAIASVTLELLGRHLNDDVLIRGGADIAEAIDSELWHPESGLWQDHAIIGDGATQAVPTLDGVLPILCSRTSERVAVAIKQVDDPEKFGAEYGPRYVWRDHPTYDPDSYWRGPTWPQLNYLVWFAAHRQGRRKFAATIATQTEHAVQTSAFSEFWHPESGKARGATPQTWATVVTAMTEDLAPPPLNGTL